MHGIDLQVKDDYQSHWIALCLATAAHNYTKRNTFLQEVWQHVDAHEALATLVAVGQDPEPPRLGIGLPL